MVYSKNSGIFSTHIAISLICHAFLASLWATLLHKWLSYYILYTRKRDMSSWISITILLNIELVFFMDEMSCTSSKQLLSMMMFEIPWCRHNWRLLRTLRASIDSGLTTSLSAKLTAIRGLPLWSLTMNSIPAFFRSKNIAP